MADTEWRVAMKALYIVHRFAASGSSEHAVNLKESVAVLRTHHDSRRKVNYFDMDTICEVKAPSWSKEDVAPFSEFLRAYARFVLLRTTQFGPGFGELLDTFKMFVGEGEMLTTVSELLAAGTRVCVISTEQERPMTAAAVMLVAQDLRDVIEACAAQLDYLAREWDARSSYPMEVERWYAFLYEIQEPVEALMRRTDDLAVRHKLAPLRSLVALPLALRLRDEEVAMELQAALEAEQLLQEEKEAKLEAEKRRQEEKEAKLEAENRRQQEKEAALEAQQRRQQEKEAALEAEQAALEAEQASLEAEQASLEVEQRRQQQQQCDVEDPQSPPARAAASAGSRVKRSSRQKTATGRIDRRDGSGVKKSASSSASVEREGGGAAAAWGVSAKQAGAAAKRSGKAGRVAPRDSSSTSSSSSSPNKKRSSSSAATSARRAIEE
ncbi:unnamed protein product, partial [Laminaria digitata]